MADEYGAAGGPGDDAGEANCGRGTSRNRIIGRDTGAARTEASPSCKNYDRLTERASANGVSSASEGRAVEGKATLTDKYDPCLERAGLAKLLPRVPERDLFTR